MRILIVLMLFPAVVFAQDKYWVSFKDKKNCSLDPYSYFDQKAISRRIKSNIPLVDFTDLPVNPEYLNQVKNITGSVKMSSRWFNAACVFASEEQVKQIQKLSCVASVEKMRKSELALTGNDFDTSLSESKLHLANLQVNRLGLTHFKSKNIDGRGIRIAIFDAGFPKVDQHPAFAHIRNENRIIHTWDFVEGSANVYHANSHGTMVMSCIGGKAGETNLGLATGAEFILARTEHAVKEPYSEEENWLAAAEWADKNGADVINSSLGYTYHRYFEEEMDGKTSLVARAANMAASKGMLVVNSAGNEGTNRWKTLVTPSDADSVLCIGGLDPQKDFHINFSSYGPTADKRIKPNVIAAGDVCAASPKGYSNVQGTSFSSPLIAGFATCAWQTDTTLTNMQLFKKIEESGDLYPYFDYAHGYGVPRANYFTDPSSLNVQKDTLIHFLLMHSDVSILVDTIALPAADKEADLTDDYVWIHIAGPNGVLKEYFVYELEYDELKSQRSLTTEDPQIPQNWKEVTDIHFMDLSNGDIIRVHFRGVTIEYRYGQQ